MKKNFTFLFLMLILTINVMSQPAVQWQHLYGGTGNENLYGFSSKPTSDGGAILCGSSSSSNTGTFTGLTNNGGLDAVIIKLDASGNTTLQKLFGGSADDELWCIRQTEDGGYIAVGDAQSSNTGTLSGIINNGGKDGLVMKLNSAGDIVWQKLLGGSADEILYSVRQTSDGGYILSGNSASSNSGTLTGITNNGGAIDGWIIKLDASGNTVWQKLLGGSGYDRFLESSPTADGGYIAVGSATGNNGTLTGLTSYGSTDGWIIKLNSSGNTVWQKLYGGSSDDALYTVDQTTDGGYITASTSSSNGGGSFGTETGYGNYDGWVLKIDATGNIQWQKLFGGGGEDFFNICRQTSEGGYILSGESNSNPSAGGSLTGLTNHGGYDGWIVKLNGAGDMQWQELLGGTLDDNLEAVHETSDGGYFVAAYASSSNSGTLTGLTGNGGIDGWSVKLASYATPKKPGSGNALQFNGTNQKVETQAGEGWNFGSNDFAIEGWFNASDLSGIPTLITQSVGGAVGTVSSFYIGLNYNGLGSLSLYTTTGTGWTHSIATPPGVIQIGKWYHYAVTRQGGLPFIYINGVNQILSNNSAGATPNVGIAPIIFNGTRQIEIGAQNDLLWFNGMMDELRVFNGAGLTQTQVRDWMCKKVTSGHPDYSNIISYYKFDEGSGAATYSLGGQLGSLINSPTWITSGASIGDASAYDYTNATTTANLAASTGETFTVTNTSGAPNGLQVYRVDTIPNTTTGANSGANNKYFGVFQINGTSPTYTAVYNYTGNPLIIHESDLRLFKRLDNSVTSWTDCGATLNTTNKTLTTTGQSTEYILGVVSGTLPVSLINFSGYKENATIMLKWQSENEINFSGFEIEKSTDGLSFHSIGSATALHSAGINNYSFIDNTPVAGNNFYRLKQINADGKFTDSKIIKIDFSKKLSITITPNPAHGYININTSTVIKEVQLISLDGKLINSWTNVTGAAKLDVSDIAAGIYIFKMITATEVQSQKIMKE